MIQFLPASRQIPVHYDVAEFEADLKILGEMISVDYGCVVEQASKPANSGVE